MRSEKQAFGHALAFFTALIWGTTFIATKILLEVFTPIEILLIRFALGYVALWLVHPKRLPFLGWRRELYMVGAGLAGITLYYLFENIALTYTLASNVGVIVAIAPFFTALAGVVFLKDERPDGFFFLGFLVAISGVALISFSGSGELSINPIGDILAISAAGIWALYSVLTRKIGEFGHNTIETTRRIFFYGLIFMSMIAPKMGVNIAISDFLTPKIMFNVLFLSIGASAVCFVTWNKAIEILGAVRATVYIYMTPVITAITSAIVLKEQITWQIVIGIVLALGGLLLSESKLLLAGRRGDMK